MKTYVPQRRTGIMLCYPFEEKRLKTYKAPYLLQKKEDGIRCRAISKDGVAVLVSSEAKIIESVPHLNKAIAEWGYDGIEFDGELYVHGMPLEEIYSITSRTVNLHPNYQVMEYHIFDLVLELPQWQRLDALYKMIYHGKPHDSRIQMNEMYEVEDIDEIMEYYEGFLENGYEGIVIRDRNAPYMRKRFTQIMKFKPHKIDTYQITGYSPMVDVKTGLIKPDLLGRVICVGREGIFRNIGKYTPLIDPPPGMFAVGSGFKMDQRRLFWQIREQLPGMYIKVKYQNITSADKVPRHSVFLEVVEGPPESDDFIDVGEI